MSKKDLNNERNNEELEQIQKALTEKDKIINAQNNAIQEISNMTKSLSDLVPVLNGINEALTEVNRKSGALQRYEDIKDEILLKGWDTVQVLYHPTNRQHDKAAKEYFEFVQFVYEDIKRKKLIKDVEN